MKSLTVKKLEDDRKRLQELLNQVQLQVHYFIGAIAYINDNIKELKEEGDDRKRTDNTKQE